MITLSIESNKEDDTPQEWSLLELNGELLPSKNLPASDEMEFGKIQFESESNAKITIASHELKGEVQSLKQPFVVLRPFKRPISTLDEGQNEFEILTQDCDNSNSRKNEKDCKRIKRGYQIAGVINSKILFDEYPKSIMR